MSALDPIPSPPPRLVGRHTELRRIEASWRRVPAVVIYGVAGVGKSALAYAAAARWPGRSVHVAMTGDPIDAAIDDARRHLAGPSAPERRTPEAIVADLAQLLEAGPALLIVDDIHRAPPDGARLLLGDLIRSLRRGRLVATSRERLPVDPGGPYRLDLRLDGLDEAAARALWRSLDELYGESRGFAEAWARSRGNPFQLRRAHAGWLDDADPVAAAIAARSANELLWLRAVALSRVPLSTSVAAALLGDDAMPVLRSLTRALMIDVDAAGASTLHDLFRETLLQTTDVAARAAVHRALADALRAQPAAPPLVREVARHLRAIGDHDSSGRFLAAQSALMVRSGACVDLLRALDAIPEPARSPEIQIARAGCLARLLEVGRAFDTLAPIAESADSARGKLWFVHLAVAAGRIDVAERVARCLARRADGGPWMHAQLADAFVTMHRGDIDRARAQLRAAAGRVRDQFHIGVLAFWEVYSFWLVGAQPELELLRRARDCLSRRASGCAGPSLPMVEASLLAHAHRLDEADAILARLEPTDGRDGEPLLQMAGRLLRGLVRAMHGDCDAALAILLPLADDLHARGHVVGACWAEITVGRALLGSGHRARGLGLLDAAAAVAAAAGLGSLGGYAARSRLADPLAMLAPDAPDPATDPAAWPIEVVRARLRPVVVDARCHRVEHGGRVIDLDRRPILRQILYALARRPGLPVSKEALTASLRSSGYHPLRHDNPLRVNIVRLRRLLADAELRIESHDDGYCLVVPEHFLYVDGGVRA